VTILVLKWSGGTNLPSDCTLSVCSNHSCLTNTGWGGHAVLLGRWPPTCRAGGEASQGRCRAHRHGAQWGCPNLQSCHPVPAKPNSHPHLPTTGSGLAHPTPPLVKRRGWGAEDGAARCRPRDWGLTMLPSRTAAYTGTRMAFLLTYTKSHVQCTQGVQSAEHPV